jgi:hypothetical protein
LKINGTEQINKETQKNVIGGTSRYPISGHPTPQPGGLVRCGEAVCAKDQICDQFNENCIDAPPHQL